MDEPEKRQREHLYLTAQKMNLLIASNRQAIEAENLKIVKACNIVVAFTMLACILAACIIRQYHVVPAYCVTIVLMVAEYFICRNIMNSAAPHRHTKLLLYFFSFVVLSFSSYIIFFVTPSATYVSFIGFLVLLSMLFIDNPIRQLAFFAAIIGAFILAEIFLNPSPATQADAILNVLVIPGCSLTLGWYNCGLKLKAFDNERRLQQLSSEDVGTGLGNRRSLFENLKKMCDKGKIKGVYMIDIDNFKEYNDCYGHQMGDKCLKQVASLLQSYGSSHGISFYRFGGDEFVGLHSADSSVDIEVAANELADSVRGASIDSSGPKGFPVTISVGYADAQSCDVEEYIHKADEALYNAKESGKSRAVAFKSVGGPADRQI